MSLRRGNFDLAASLIEDADELTEDQKNSIGRLSADLEDARFEKMYLAALGLEEDFLYVEAVQAYDELRRLTDAANGATE